MESLGSVFARMCSVPTTVSATRSGALLTPSPCESRARSSAGERAATASVAPHASVTARLASSARAAALTTSGNPAPDSTASVIASSAARSDIRSAPEVDGCESAGHPGPHEHREHVQREHRRGQPLPQTRVGRPGRSQDERTVESQPQDGGAARHKLVDR